MRSAALTAALALVIAAPVAAQRPMSRDTARHALTAHRTATPSARQGMGGMQAGAMRCSMMGAMMHDSAMGTAMGSMMQVMGGSAEHVLAAKTTLHLTAEQESRITAIRDAARTEHDNALRDAEHHEQELAEVMRAASPDTSAMKAHFEAAQSAMGQAHLAELRSAALTRAELTDEQRRQVDSREASMGCGMMGGSASQASHGR